MIDEVGGRLHHAARSATGAKTPPFAAECHQVLVQATATLDPKKSVFEQPALQLVLELLAHEHRQVAAGGFDFLE